MNAQTYLAHCANKVRWHHARHERAMASGSRLAPAYARALAWWREAYAITAEYEAD